PAEVGDRHGGSRRPTDELGADAPTEDGHPPAPEALDADQGPVVGVGVAVAAEVSELRNIEKGLGAHGVGSPFLFFTRLAVASSMVMVLRPPLGRLEQSG